MPASLRACCSRSVPCAADAVVECNAARRRPAAQALGEPRNPEPPRGRPADPFPLEAGRASRGMGVRQQWPRRWAPRGIVRRRRPRAPYRQARSCRQRADRPAGFFSMSAIAYGFYQRSRRLRRRIERRWMRGTQTPGTFVSEIFARDRGRALPPTIRGMLTGQASRAVVAPAAPLCPCRTSCTWGRAGRTG